MLHKNIPLPVHSVPVAAAAQPGGPNMVVHSTPGNVTTVHNASTTVRNLMRHPVAAAPALAVVRQPVMSVAASQQPSALQQSPQIFTSR